MRDGAEVVVVGAGIVGAACAAELAEAGRDVVLLERGVAGGGATAAGMGHVVAMDGDAAELALSALGVALWEARLRAEGGEHEHLGCGTLWVAADAAEMDEAAAKRDRFAAAGVRCRLLGAAALHELEPHLRPGLAGALLVPGDMVVYPPASAQAWVARAGRAGARLVRGAAARLRPGGLELADGTAWRAETVVVAGGAWSAELLPGLPLLPRKGHLAITDRYPGFVRHQLVELGYVHSAHAAAGASVAFNVQPRPTGQVLIGSSRQTGVGTSAVDGATLARMLRRAVAYLPALAGLSCIRVWTGVRPATPDGQPLIGPHPDLPGVWLATGHEGLGITTAPATARLLAAQLLGRPAPIAPEPYLPARFLAGTPPAPAAEGTPGTAAAATGGESAFDVPPGPPRVSARPPASGPLLHLTVDGRSVSVPRGSMVAAAVARAGSHGHRRSLGGEERAPLCGMGVCHECRVTVDGRAHRLGCQTPCADGMRVETG